MKHLLFILLFVCPIVAFGQDFVGKIPTQERKIKLHQIEERSNRVPPTADIWLQYAKATNKAEQRVAADKALAMLYGDAAFYSYINNHSNEAAVAQMTM